MNIKGQRKISGVSMFLIVFVLAILGTVFLESIADSTTKATTTLTNVNETITVPAAGSTVNLKGKLVTDFIGYNATGAPVPGSEDKAFNSTAPIGEGNFTLLDNVFDSDGTHTAQYQTATNGYVGSLNVSYTYQPIGYISTGGARTLTNLVIIMFAIGLLLFVGSRLFNTDNFRRIVGRMTR